MKMSLVAIIGVAVLVVSTIGFGATLSTNPGASTESVQVTIRQFQLQEETLLPLHGLRK
ncbi:hypothetical protein BG20_I1483 [Candidatus Nitrosarchaeum limnium BG20]|uniref:Uncharacterized protein n=1 Tax=Candidatus Nitrosarchaeum limnium BG20 TaxID=859192 RepID=S2E432_9ARCH|nr:hypothetical protein BG20_I1483 [Candidatus Nitrosarchaeum limnium BG20]